MANKTQTIAKTSTPAKAAPAKAAKASSAVAAAKQAAKAKAAPKVEAKAETKAAPTVTALIIAGITERLAKGSSFYSSAIAYHVKQKTVFPRARNTARREALTVEQVKSVFDKHDKKILSAGDGIAQAAFDVYMMNR